MAFGDHPQDEAMRRAWGQFCRALETAGEQVFKDSLPANDLQRADAFRYLTQNLSQAFDLALETRDPRHPVIHAFCTPFRKVGGDNADFLYQQAWIDGESVYRISGNRGTCRFLNVAVQGARPTRRDDDREWRPLHEPFGDIPQANVFGHQLACAWDGSFELFIGGERRGANWLPTTAESRKLFIRQGFDDWSERPATVRIERVGMAEPRALPGPEDIVDSLGWAAEFVSGVMSDWPEWPFAFGEGVDPNQLNRFPAERTNVDDPVYNPQLDQKRGRAPQTMCWKLAPDEALVIEWAADDTFWMMTNMGMTFNSMDYLYRPVSYSPARAKVDDDGMVRLVLAHRDPGFHNWIDTQEFERGVICNRNMLTSRHTNFATSVCKQSELARALVHSPRMTPEERTEQMMMRFHSILRRIGA